MCDKLSILILVENSFLLLGWSQRQEREAVYLNSRLCTFYRSSVPKLRLVLSLILQSLDYLLGSITTDG